MGGKIESISPAYAGSLIYRPSDGPALSLITISFLTKQRIQDVTLFKFNSNIKKN